MSYSTKKLKISIIDESGIVFVSENNNKYILPHHKESFSDRLLQSIAKENLKIGIYYEFIVDVNNSYDPEIIFPVACLYEYDELEIINFKNIMIS